MGAILHYGVGVGGEGIPSNEQRGKGLGWQSPGCGVQGRAGS